MKNVKLNKRPLILSFSSVAVIAAAVVLGGCGGSSTASESSKTYQITVTNNMSNQPLSPVAIVVHKSGYHLWQVGQPASVGLEKLAEGGGTSTLIDEAVADTMVIAHEVGSTHIGPGGNEVITLSYDSQESDLKISLATMLVNTNDAFAGLKVNGIDELAVNEVMKLTSAVYDAGTEKNTESAGTIPGPADGGQGFDPSREGDSNFVAMHQGVVSKDDGLASSVLNESHRFDNPALGIVIKRTK